MYARPVNQVVVDRSARGTEAERSRVLFAEVEPATPGVVQQNSVAAARATRRHEKRVVFIKGGGRFLEAIGVGVPECERLPPPIERARLVSQTKDVLLLR